MIRRMRKQKIEDRRYRTDPLSSIRYLRCFYNRQLNAGSVGLRSEHALCGGDVIRILRLENVLDIFLRITINHWEPGALNLNHDLVSLLETVILMYEINVELGHLVGSQRFRFIKAIVISAA